MNKKLMQNDLANSYDNNIDHMVNRRYEALKNTCDFENMINDNTQKKIDDYERKMKEKKEFLQNEDMMNVHLAEHKQKKDQFDNARDKYECSELNRINNEREMRKELNYKNVFIKN